MGEFIKQKWVDFLFSLIVSLLACLITISATSKNRNEDFVNGKADKSYVDDQNTQIRTEIQRGDEQNKNDLDAFKKASAEKDAIILDYLKSIDSKQNIILSRTR